MTERKLAVTWPHGQIVRRAAARIPWRSDPGLLDKQGALDTRVRYISKIIEPGDYTEVQNGDVAEGLKARAARLSVTNQQKSRELSL